MKHYDFETVVRRYGVGSGKWDKMRPYTDAADDIIPFSLADMEFKNAPEIIEGLQKYLDSSILGYAQPTDAYVSAVCGWMRSRHGWSVEPEQILGAPGVINAFFTAVKAFTKEGEGVMLMTPVYYPMYAAISRNNRALVENRLIAADGRYEIDFGDFVTKARDPHTKLLILCSPHNPTGRVWTVEELTRIGRICTENGVLVVSDEIHNDIIMQGYKHTVFASLNEAFAQGSATCTAPSKTFNLAGLQTANIIIPNRELREAYWKEVCTTQGNPKCNILGLEACRLAYAKGEDWLEQVLKIIDTNRGLVADFMASQFPQIKVFKLEGTYLLWLDFRALGVESGELSRILKEEGRLFFDDGYLFGEQGAGFVRWNLACPTRYIRDGLSRLKAILDKRLC